MALWLHNAGYRTGLIGKYINAYPNPEPPSYVPPGWDYWAASIKSGSADVRLHPGHERHGGDGRIQPE